MFFKRKKIEVVHPSEYTDFSDRFAELEKIREENGYATRKHVAIASAVPTVASLGFAAHRYFSTPPVEEPINVMAQAPTIEPIIPEPTSLIDTYTPLMVTAIPQQTGVIADASLQMLATILDPVVQLLVAISFPIASVIVVCAFFMIMIGNKERAFDMMLNAGLGYILIQLSPVFLDILRNVGNAF